MRWALALALALIAPHPTHTRPAAAAAVEPPPDRSPLPPPRPPLLAAGGATWAKQEQDHDHDRWAQLNGAPSLAVGSWNVWGMPYISTNVMSRTGRTGVVARRNFAKSVEWMALDGADLDLQILCFQEAWAFRAGLALPFNAMTRYLERKYPSIQSDTLPTGKKTVDVIPTRNSAIGLLSLSVSALIGWTMPVNAGLWDPKAEISASVAEAVAEPRHRLPGFPYSVGLDSVSMSLRPHKLVDSGLLILANRRPESSGFTAYHETAGEAAANKGFLWAVYPTTPRLATLVVTTHLSDEGLEHRCTQLEQLRVAMLATADDIERVSGRAARIVLAGDLNTASDVSFGPLAQWIASMGLERISYADRMGTVRDPGLKYHEIDYILVSKEHVQGRNATAQISWNKMSDHRMIVAAVRGSAL